MNQIAHYSKFQHGFSLIEIMVAMTLGLILMLGITSLIATNNTTYRLTDNMGRVQENARFLQNTLNTELRMIGYKGCVSRQNMTITNTLNDSSDLAYNFSDNGLVGYDNISATLPDELNSFFSGDPQPLQGSDLLILRAPHGNNIAIVDNNDAAQLFAASAASSAFSIGDIVMVSDCKKARIFQITNITTNAKSGKANIVHSKSGNVSPGNSIASWGPPASDESFGTSAHLVAYSTTAYFIANNPATGIPTLYKKVNAGAASALINGVYGFQIRYGEDTDGDSQVNAYRDASDVSNWNNIIAIRIETILGSDDTGMVTKPQTLSFNQSTFEATDCRWYMTKQIVSTLRNRIN